MYITVARGWGGVFCRHCASESHWQGNFWPQNWGFGGGSLDPPLAVGASGVEDAVRV